MKDKWHILMTFGEHVWRKKKEQSFLETSRKDDHMPWPPRSLETFRRSIHLALAKKASRMCPCDPFVDLLFGLYVLLFAL